MKNSKYLFFAFIAFLIIAAASEDKPKTFESDIKWSMLTPAENAVKKLLNHPTTYERLEWVAKKTTDSTASYVIKFTSKNSFGVSLQNKAQVDVKYNTEENTGQVINYFTLKN